MFDLLKNKSSTDGGSLNKEQAYPSRDWAFGRLHLEEDSITYVGESKKKQMFIDRCSWSVKFSVMFVRNLW